MVLPTTLFPKSCGLPFESFSVQCLTCGSRLKVSDPAIVGTIAACPRCNSMVQIDLPANQVAVGASDVDSQAITEDAIAVPEDAGIPADDAPTGFSGSADVDSSDPEAEDSSAPPPSWQSQRTHRSRQIALVVAVSVTGLLTAVLFFSWFVRNWKEQATPAVAIDSQQDSHSTEPAETIAPETDLPETNTPEVENVSPDKATDPDLAAANADPSNNGPPNVEPAAAAPTIGTPNAESAAQETVPSEIPIPGDLINPIDVDASAKSQQDAQKAAEEEAAPMELPSDLADLRNLLEINGPRDLAPNTDAPPSEADVDIDAAAQNDLDPFLDITEPQKINLKADFAMLLALDSRGYRFADLILLFSQLTSVPIQIDWVSFDLAGIDVHAPVQIPQGEMSIGDLLEKVCAALGAEVQEHEYFVVVTPSDESFALRQQALTDLADFASGRESAVNVLNEFLHGPQEARSDELRVGETRQDQQFAMLAVESLRRMRGHDPKLADSLLKHWAQASQNQSIEWPILTGGIQAAQRSTPISVAELIRRAAKRNDASCVVFWADAIPRKLSPVHVLLPKSEKDAGETLNQLASEYGLQVRQVDANRWWLGSPSTYDRASVVVWTAPLGENADAFRGRMNTVMAGRDEFRFMLDPQSDRAIMLLPRYIVRQLPKIEASVAAN